MQNNSVFKGVKIEFLCEKCDIFRSFAQNIDCGYMLELSH